MNQQPSTPPPFRESIDFDRGDSVRIGGLVITFVRNRHHKWAMKITSPAPIDARKLTGKRS